MTTAGLLSPASLEERAEAADLGDVARKVFASERLSRDLLQGTTPPSQPRQAAQAWARPLRMASQEARASRLGL